MHEKKDEQVTDCVRKRTGARSLQSDVRTHFQMTLIDEACPGNKSKPVEISTTSSIHLAGAQLK